MARCFIFGALPVSALSEKPEDGDLIIAADKGYDVALSLGLTPDLTVGDFDSRGEAPDTDGVVVLPVRKNDTDVGHAVELGFSKGYDTFVIYGAVGGELDHTFANVVIAHDIARRGGKALLIGESFSYTILHNSAVSFAPRESGRISVFALGSTAYGVSIQGLSYELDRYDLACTSHLGVSNAFIGKPSLISVADGDLLVVYQNAFK